MKILNFSKFMKMNESTGVATKIGSLKLPNGKTINMFTSNVIDPDTKQSSIQPAFDIDGGSIALFYSNGKIKSGLLQQSDKKIKMDAFGAKDQLEYNEYLDIIAKAFKDKGITVNLESSKID